LAGGFALDLVNEPGFEYPVVTAEVIVKGDEFEYAAPD
jgi:hypothetical protein